MEHDEEKTKILITENGLKPEFFNYKAVHLFTKDMRQTMRKIEEKEELYASIPIFSFFQRSKK